VDENLELIERQIRETRNNLSERVETLEREVFGIVHGTTTAVTESMENAKEAVHETVSEVKDSFHEVIETLRDTVDIRLQVERHPYAVLCGAVIVGYLTPRLVDRLTVRPIPQNGQPLSQAFPSTIGPAPEKDTPQLGHFGSDEKAAVVPQGHLSPDISTLSQGRFAYEIGRLKAIVLGTAFGALRDYIVESTPQRIGTELADIIDSVTRKLGGQPIPGPVFSSNASSSPRI
jgi:hypothetical protein